VDKDITEAQNAYTSVRAGSSSGCRRADDYVRAFICASYSLSTIGLGSFSVETLIELRSIKVQIGGEFFQVGFGVRADVLAAPFGKQFVVIFPELALFVCAFRSIRRPM